MYRKINQKNKVIRFVHTYHFKKQDGQIDKDNSGFFHCDNSPSSPVTINKAYPYDLSKPSKIEAEEIFECIINWDKNHKWNMEGARHHQKGWFEFVNTYLLI